MKLKRILAGLLTMVLCAGLLPVTVSASGDVPEIAVGFDIITSYCTAYLNNNNILGGSIGKAQEGDEIKVYAENIPEGKYFTGTYNYSGVDVITIVEDGAGSFTMPANAVSINAVLADQEGCAPVFTNGIANLPEGMADLLMELDDQDYYVGDNNHLDLNKDGYADIEVDETADTATILEGAVKLTSNVTIPLSVSPYYRYNSVTFTILYEIKFVDDDDTVLKEAVQYAYGTLAASIEKPADPTKQETAEYSYTFAGWITADTKVEGIKNVTCDVTYQAKYTSAKRSYEITWKNDDGNVIDVTKAEYGTVPEHADAEKKSSEGHVYVFIGWDKEVVAVTGPAEYKAKYREEPESSSSAPDSETSSIHNEEEAEFSPVQVIKKRYKITWKYEDGTKIDETTVEEGKVPVHADPAMASTAEYTYEFIGWDREPAKVSGPATYTAMFRRIKNIYSVQFESYGGTTLAPLTAEYGDFINRPADPMREEDTFEGWYKDEALSEPYSFTEPVVQNITLYAKWTVAGNILANSELNGANNAARADQEQAAVRVAQKTDTQFSYFYYYDENGVVTRRVVTMNWVENGVQKQVARIQLFDSNGRLIESTSEGHNADSYSIDPSFGAGQGEIVSGTGQSAIFRINRSENNEHAIDNFDSAYIGKVNTALASGYTSVTELGGSQMRVRSGSIIIELLPEYLDTLEQGDYILFVFFKDADPLPISFSIAAKAAGNTKNEGNEQNDQVVVTGDLHRVGVPISLLAASLIGIAALLLVRSRLQG